MPQLAGQDLLRSLLADGIVEGVGAVLAFVPMIMLPMLLIQFIVSSISHGLRFRYNYN